MKSAYFTTKIEEIVYNDNDSNNAEASVSLNPTFAWAKFILTDDQPNENKQRIPKSEFANLIKTGIHAPMKMGIGKINEDHSDAFPIGVITNLKETENKVEGIAALWTKEREEDVASLKEMYKDGKLPQLSWEILHEDTKVNDDGIEDLVGTSLRALTVVGMPAYAGRTPIFALASKNKNSSTEELNVEELEQLKAKVAELEALIAQKETELSAKASEVDTFKVELEDLRTFKGNIEKEQEATKKLESIKTKFQEAGLVKDETYFSDNKDKLLGLSDEALDFMVQELVSFSKSSKEEKSSKKPEVPNLESDPLKAVDPKEIGRQLRQKLINQK